MATEKTFEIKVRRIKKVKGRPTYQLKKVSENLNYIESIVEIDSLKKANTVYFEVSDTAEGIKSIFEKKINQKNYTVKHNKI